MYKSNHTCTTSDGWRLHLVRTRQKRQSLASGRLYPVLCIPGLASSGAYSFDLSPDVSFVDFLASNGFDVWVCELRGNGLSDKASLLGGRSHWWTIDDLVERDVPAVMDYVCLTARCSAMHVVGHSMGGMILTAVLARQDAIAARIRSAMIVGSSCFLEGSWWGVLQRAMPVTKALYSVPAGLALRLYSWLAFTRLAVRALDVLYFWPTNTVPALARAVMARNFSSTSPGVISQFGSAFLPGGLRSALPPYQPFARPEAMACITTPVMMLCGSKDKMCPPQGARKQYELMSGCSDKKLAVLGRNTGNSTHFGHFDILMGKAVHTEVFPLVLEWLDKHDCLPSDMAVMTTASAAPCVSIHHMSEGNAKDARLVPENEGRAKRGPGEAAAQDAAGDVLPGLKGEGVTSDSVARNEHGRRQAASTSASLSPLLQLQTGVRSKL